MKIAILNRSTRVSDADVEKMAQAVEVQVASHVAPLWDRMPASVTFYADPAQAPTDADQVVVFDDADQAGALGYHSEGPDGKPYGKVFAALVLDNGGGVLDGGSAGDSVSSVLSHEVIELFGNPSINLWVDGPARPEGSCYARELCDMMQGNNYAVKLLDGTSVLVSDFATPNWFDEGAPDAAVRDWCQVVKTSFALAPGGYMVVRAAPGSEQQVFGEVEPPAWKLAARKHPASRPARLGA